MHLQSKSKDRDRKKEEEEVKKLLGGGKLIDRTFQIPKLTSSTPPQQQQQRTPTTSPKYSNVSPKGQTATGSGLPPK